MNEGRRKGCRERCLSDGGPPPVSLATSEGERPARLSRPFDAALCVVFFEAPPTLSIFFRLPPSLANTATCVVSRVHGEQRDNLLAHIFTRTKLGALCLHALSSTKSFIIEREEGRSHSPASERNLAACGIPRETAIAKDQKLMRFHGFPSRTVQDASGRINEFFVLYQTPLRGGILNAAQCILRQKPVGFITRGRFQFPRSFVSYVVRIASSVVFAIFDRLYSIVTSISYEAGVF